jgi:hypothetical protein
MPKYSVSQYFEIEADNHEAAAVAAFHQQRAPASSATLYHVAECSEGELIEDPREINLSPQTSDHHQPAAGGGFYETVLKPNIEIGRILEQWQGATPAPGGAVQMSIADRIRALIDAGDLIAAQNLVAGARLNAHAIHSAFGSIQMEYKDYGEILKLGAEIRRRINQAASPSRPTGALSVEQARNIFLATLAASRDYWIDLPDVSVGAKLDGLCFQILCMFDGRTLGMPAMDIVLRSHEDDKADSTAAGETYFEDGTVINDCELAPLWPNR